ncbi:hypothetical protein YPPY52_2059 [Yersinia pestis PY-52]|nr:hypothetical protein YPPY52_2059 [Yersinia pestis PY-52]
MLWSGRNDRMIIWGLEQPKTRATQYHPPDNIYVAGVGG